MPPLAAPPPRAFDGDIVSSTSRCSAGGCARRPRADGLQLKSGRRWKRSSPTSRTCSDFFPPTTSHIIKCTACAAGHLPAVAQLWCALRAPNPACLAASGSGLAMASACALISLVLSARFLADPAAAHAGSDDKAPGSLAVSRPRGAAGAAAGDDQEAVGSRCARACAPLRAARGSSEAARSRCVLN